MRQQLITIPLLNVLIQWIKDRLDEKSNTNHTHDYAPTTHTHTAAQVTQSSTARFVTDAEKTAWTNKVGKEGGSMTGGLIAKPSDDTRQMRNIAVGTTAPTSTTGYSEGDIFLVVP